MFVWCFFSRRLFFVVFLCIFIVLFNNHVIVRASPFSDNVFIEHLVTDLIDVKLILSDWSGPIEHSMFDLGILGHFSAEQF